MNIILQYHIYRCRRCYTRSTRCMIAEEADCNSFLARKTVLQPKGNADYYCSLDEIDERCGAGILLAADDVSRSYYYSSS